MQSLFSYLQEVTTHIVQRDGSNLASLLLCSDKHALNHKLAVSEPENYVMNEVLAPWDVIVSAHLRCLWAISKKNLEESYACQIIITKTIAKIFSELKEENWILPVVIAVAVDLRRFSYDLDFSSGLVVDEKRNYGGNMERAAQLIMKLFQICAADSRTVIEDSKKRGMMGLANQLFKIYFQINKLNLCKSIVRAIENMNMDSYFSLAQRVTFNYYVGRKAMFDGELSAANASLTFAFERSLASQKHNKRLVLIYLVPVRMLLGIFPKPSLLRKYNLKEFVGIVEAVKAGNLEHFNQELDRFENFFITCGVYLILERLKMSTYRNLFKRVASILSTHLLPIPVFTEALRLMGMKDVDAEETECILANLIYEGKIKGYLAHQQQKLVVSKVQAFPPLKSSTFTSR